MSDATARGFLDDVLANPEDDAPRLIFADWLEDNGQPDRAEFIRSQVERARLPEWDARHVRLSSRERVLLGQHETEWRKGLPVIKGVNWGEFRRGFVAAATFATFEALVANAGTCRAAAPVEAVSVRWPHKGDGIGPIAGLRDLSVTGRLVSTGDMSRLADMPLLSTLRSLTISGANLGLVGFRGLVGSPHLRNLTALRVPHNSIGNGGIGVLGDGDPLPSLAELDLSELGEYGRYGEDPFIDASGMALLARWRGLARLRSLSLSGNEARRDGLRFLLESPHVTGLKSLEMCNNGLTGRDMDAFAAAGSALKLDVLDLGENLLRELGVDYLTKAPCLRELKVLALDTCEFRSAAASKLAKAPFLATLRSLDVGYGGFNAKELSALLAANPPELHTLDLAYNNLGDIGAARLADSPASDRLLRVNLEGNGLGEKAARSLAASDHLRNLLELRMKGNAIPKTAATALAKSPLGKRLAVLEVDEAAGRRRRR